MREKHLLRRIKAGIRKRITEREGPEMYITLAQVRRHLNLDEDFHDDDAYIVESLIPAAERAVSRRIDRRLEDCVDEGTGLLPGTISQAILLLTGTFYSQREASTPSSIRENPFTLEYLADLERRYTVL